MRPIFEFVKTDLISMKIFPVLSFYTYEIPLRLSGIGKGLLEKTTLYDGFLAN